MRVWCVLIVLAVLSAGCVAWPRAPADAPPSTRPTGQSATQLPPEAEWTGRNVTLAGRVVDNMTGERLANATVVVTLVSHPVRGGCPEDVLVSWATWTPAIADDGAFGPIELPEPAGGGLAYRVLAVGESHRETIFERRAADPSLANLTIRLDPVGTLVFDVPHGSHAAWIRDGAPLSALSTAHFPGGASVESLAAGRYHVVVGADGASPFATTVDVPAYGRAEVIYVPMMLDGPAPARGVVRFGNETFQGVMVVAVDDAERPVGIARSGLNGTFDVHVREEATLVASARVVPADSHEGGLATATARARSGDESVVLALELPACRTR